MVSFTESASLKSFSIKELLSKSVADGIVCTDDLTALLVLQAARELGISVPNDLKVTGFDGTELLQLIIPELSTVVQPLEDIASVLINLLLERIKIRMKNSNRWNTSYPSRLRGPHQSGRFLVSKIQCPEQKIRIKKRTSRYSTGSPFSSSVFAVLF